MSAPPNASSLLPPPGTNFIEAIRPSLNFIMIGTIFTTLLIPLLICLLYFSTPDMRKRPVFILNIGVIVLGLVDGLWNGYMEVHAILSPSIPLSQATYVAFYVFYILTPALVDTILLFRLLVVFPPQHTPRWKLALVFSLPISLLILRIIVIGLFTNAWNGQVHNIGNVILAAQQYWKTSPYVKIEWSAQLVNNAYCSSLFLWRIYQQDGGLLLRKNIQNGSGYFGKYLRGLFFIAITNFVPPVIFNLVQLIILARGADFFLGTYVQMVNTYISIVSIVFATVWAGTSRWTHKHSGPRTAPLSYNSGHVKGNNVTMNWAVAAPSRSDLPGMSGSETEAYSGDSVGVTEMKSLPLEEFSTHQDIGMSAC